MKGKTNGRLARVAFLAVALFVMMAVLSPSAQTTTEYTGQFCSAAIPSTSNTPLGNYGTLSGILGISLLIMVIMASVAALVYMIGYSAKINKLVNFSKQEFGEIFVTILIVLIFVGGFAAATVFTPPKIISGTGAYNYNVFYNDCNLLAAPAVQFFGYYIDLAIAQDVQALIASLRITIMPYNFGLAFSPFGGLATANAPVGLLMTALGGIGGFLIAMSIVLGVFYSIMPLFLFAGIILRTLPWTRAAGGSFLAVFIAFYMVFPILLHFMLVVAPAPPPAPSWISTSVTGLTGGIVGNPTDFAFVFTTASTFLSTFDPLQLVLFLINLFAQNFYVVFCVVFSFIISFDFMDAAGDLLGAPSLNSSKSLNKLL